MQKCIISKCLAFVLVILFVLSALTPMVVGYTFEPYEMDEVLDNLRFMCTDVNGFSQEKFDYYKEKLLNQYSSDYIDEDTVIELEEQELTIPVTSTTPIASSGGPMDSPWPMKCFDVHHTSRSPYNTADTRYEEWRYETSDWVEAGIVIDNDGIIYFGDFDRYLYALYPNGTEKWRYKTGGWIWSSPAIDEDRTIYIGSLDCGLYAFNPDGTKKWRFGSGGSIVSSPAIAEDGTIYFGNMGSSCRIYAVNPDGTEKWHYTTGYYIVSDPAIGDDGTIYIGSSDTYLYAMNPDGTLKWRFKTGDWIQGSPSVANDGTIHIGSFDDYLYALHPNGTMKWKYKVGPGTETNPSIASDGTIYVGSDRLYAVNSDGTARWSFNPGSDRFIDSSSPAISAEGIIYFGTEIGNMKGGEIIAVNSNGTERWRKKIANDWVKSSPSIAEDGTVYIGSTDIIDNSYLHAFGAQGPDNPEAPTINGPTNGNKGTSYNYTFKSTDPNEDDLFYYIEWGDGSSIDWFGPFGSGEEVTKSHTWSKMGDYTIRAKAKDTNNLEGNWGTLTVTMPRNIQLTNPLFMRMLYRFPILREMILRLTLG